MKAIAFHCYKAETIYLLYIVLSIYLELYILCRTIYIKYIDIKNIELYILKFSIIYFSFPLVKQNKTKKTIKTVFCCLETGSHFVAQGNLKLAM